MDTNHTSSHQEEKPTAGLQTTPRLAGLDGQGGKPTCPQTSTECRASWAVGGKLNHVLLTGRLLCGLRTVRVVGCRNAGDSDPFDAQRIDAAAQLDQGHAHAVAGLKPASDAADRRLVDAGGFGHRLLREALTGKVFDEVVPHG